MGLGTVFIVISVSILLITGVFWLIYWLTKPERISENPYAEKTTSHAEVSQQKEEEHSKAIDPKETAVSEYINTLVPDDLKVIEGIGPKISVLLNDNGIYTYHQLAETKVISLESILMEAQLRMVDPDTWPEQAALAAEGQWAALRQLQNELKTGSIIE